MSDISISAITGLTVTARLFLSGVACGSVIPVPETGTTGEYAANIPGGIVAGTYIVVFSTSSGKLGAGQLRWDGSKEISDTTPTAADRWRT